MILVQKRGKKIIKKWELFFRSMDHSFCAATVAGLVLTILALFLTHGSYFSELFYYDTIDTGMDFFHSIEYTRGRAPYDLYHTLYPPLANLCFYLLYCLVPVSFSEMWADTFSGGIAARGTGIDLRVHQSTLLLFIIFVILISACLVLLVRKILSDHIHAEAVSLCMLFSYGMLYAYERGNIVVVSMLCSMIFVFYKDSSNQVISELSLLALAFGAGLKLYPAVFGVLLLYDKQYKKALRTVGYGIVMFAAPVLAFKEGLSGIWKFAEILFSHTQGEEYIFSAKGLSFDRIISSILYFVDKIMHCGINEEMLQMILPKCNIAVAILILLCGAFLQKNWERVLACTLAFILYQNQGLYILSFLLIPLLAVIKEEKRISVNNILPFVALIFSTIVLPSGNLRYAVYTSMYGRIQFCIMILMGYILFAAVSDVRNSADEWKQCRRGQIEEK